VLKASGGDLPYFWTLIEPNQSSLTFNSAGVLTGTPTTDGTFVLSFQVTDNNGAIAQLNSPVVIQIIVDAGTASAPSNFKAVPLTITTQTLGVANSLSSFARVVQATGGKRPYNWTGRDMNSPATGLTVDPIAGSITGDLASVPIGSYNYAVTVQDANGNSDTRTYLIEVF
jgi:hypothetical protein